MIECVMSRTYYPNVRQQVDRFCESIDRDPASVRIVGITKYVDAATTAGVIDDGCTLCGESRPQVLWEKAAALEPRSVQWHLIGHLQRNKVTRTVPLLSMLQSLDSLRLAKEVAKQCELINRTLDCLIEVNVSNETQKTGLPPDEAERLLEECRQLPGLRICGIMSMASQAGDEVVAKQFRRGRELLERWSARWADEMHPLNELSMGMSGDWPIAIAEGATMVRIGTALFSGGNVAEQGEQSS